MYYFAKMPESILLHPALSSSAGKLYGIMLRRAGTRGRFYDGMPTLARLMNLSPDSTKTVRRLIKELEDVNAIRVDRSTMPNGYPGGYTYSILPEDEITGVDRGAIRTLLSNGRGVDAGASTANPGSVDPGLADLDPGSVDPQPLVEQPPLPQSPSETPDLTAAPPSAPRSTAAPPGGAAAKRDDYRHAAQWHGRAGETSEDRAIRLVARALTATGHRDVLPATMRAIVLEGKYDYESLTDEDRLLCDAVDELRAFNVEHARGQLNMRLNDDQLLDCLERAMRANALLDLGSYLEGMR